MLEKNFYWCKLFPYPIFNAIVRLHWCYFSLTSLNLHFRWRSICFQGHNVWPPTWNQKHVIYVKHTKTLICSHWFTSSVFEPLSNHRVITLLWNFITLINYIGFFFYLFQTKTHLTNYRLLVFISCIYRGGGGYSWTFLHMFKVTYWSLTFRARFQL